MMTAGTSGGAQKWQEEGTTYCLRCPAMCSSFARSFRTMYFCNLVSLAWPWTMRQSIGEVEIGPPSQFTSLLQFFDGTYSMITIAIPPKYIWVP
jgi:hypothetical protein